MLEGFRRISAVAILVVPMVLGFFGITLPSDALNGVFDGFDKVIASVLVVLSALRPAPSVIAPK